MHHHDPDTAHALASLLVSAAEAGDERLYAALEELAGDPEALAELSGGMSESVVLENFTGDVTDSAGHKRHYVNGKQVAQPTEPAAEPKSATPDEHAAGLLSKLAGMGRKVAAAAKMVGDKATELAMRATAKMAELGLDPADVLTTPEDEGKLYNDRAVNQQLADSLGLGLNGPVLAVVTKLAAYGITRLKAAIRRQLGSTPPKSAEGDKRAAVVEFWQEMLAEAMGEELAPTPEGVAAWLATPAP